MVIELQELIKKASGEFDEEVRRIRYLIIGLDYAITGYVFILAIYINLLLIAGFLIPFWGYNPLIILSFSWIVSLIILIFKNKRRLVARLTMLSEGYSKMGNVENAK